MSKLVSINPSNYQVLGEVEISEKKEIQEKVNLAGKAQKKWSMLSIHKRVSQLSSLLPLFEKKREELSILAAREMGMPLTQARSDFDYGIKFLEWYFENVSKYLEPEITYQNNFEVCKVHYEPIGVVAAIVPWNYPFSNFVWQAGQNLVVGNAVIFKYSEEIPLFSKEIERTFSESEVMEGVFSQVYGNGAVGWDLVNQEIDLICFTGSTKTGKELYKLAGERSIPAKLELGGSAPGIVFADADIDKAIETIFENRFGNNGQMCDGLKRLIVHKSKYNEVVTKLKEVLESKNIGDPLDGKTDIGPLSAKRQLECLKEQVEDALTKGAEVLYSKELSPVLSGAFYGPTLLGKVTSDMKVWQEEVFGPVLPIVTFEKIEEALDLANDTCYGLGGYIFTEDKDIFQETAARIDTGMIGQNNTSYVNPASPFGGNKDSGFGRIHGKYGFRELCKIKVVSEEKR